MELIKNEKVLLTSDTNELTLTTHRVRFKSSGYGFGTVISFLLEELDSCSIMYRSNPILIILAVLFIIGGLIASGQQRAGGIVSVILMVAVILIIAFFLTRKAVLRISSKNSHIYIKIKSMSMEKIIEFIDSVESAKYKIHLKEESYL